MTWDGLPAGAIPRNGCPRCVGTGFDSVEADVCRCVQPDPVTHVRPRTMTEREADRLEDALTGILVRAGRVNARARARTLASGVASGTVPSSVAMLVGFLRVSEDVAADVMNEIRAAISRGKGER